MESGLYSPRPESLGLVCASVYILLLILFIPFAFSDVFLNDYEVRSRHGIVVAEFPHQKVRCILFLPTIVFDTLLRHVARGVSFVASIINDCDIAWIPGRCL